jgi:Ca2+-binding EF-hand superfamily protein
LEVSLDEAAFLFERQDVDDNGTMDFSEFLAMMLQGSRHLR